jgi:short-subunit dehydrogenase
MASTKAALVTGASAGIGAEFARLLAAEGKTLLLTARREDRLVALAEELRGAHGVRVEIVPADLAEPAAPQALADKAASLGLEIDLLVNNAGFGLRGAFAERPLDRQIAMIMVNMAALTRLTGLFLPPMLKLRQGGIINVASIAAFQPGPLMSVYYASKAYVLSFSEALSQEVKGAGVVVTALCPGLTQSEFAEVAGYALSPRIERAAMTSREVARLGLAAHRAGRRVAITGIGNKLFAAAAHLLPHGLSMSLIAAIQKSAGPTGASGAGAAS